MLRNVFRIFQQTATTSAAINPTLVNPSTVVIANSDTATDTVVRSTADGAAESLNLQSNAAPATFSWDVAVQPDETIQTQADGSIAVLADDIPESTQPSDVPAAPDPTSTPATLSSVANQLDSAKASLSAAAAVSHKHVAAVIHPPVVVAHNGVHVPATITMTPSPRPGVAAKVTVHITPPGGSYTGAQLPVIATVPVDARVDHPCGPAGSGPCFDFDFGRALTYAEKYALGRNTEPGRV